MLESGRALRFFGVPSVLYRSHNTPFPYAISMSLTNDALFLLTTHMDSNKFLVHFRSLFTNLSRQNVVKRSVSVP